MLQYEKIEQCGQKGLATPGSRLVDAGGRSLCCRYNDMNLRVSRIATSSLWRGNSITSKVTLPLGYSILYSMGFALLSLITWKPHV